MKAWTQDLAPRGLALRCLQKYLPPAKGEIPNSFYDLDENARFLCVCAWCGKPFMNTKCLGQHYNRSHICPSYDRKGLGFNFKPHMLLR
jgi:hypothetical protein